MYFLTRCLIALVALQASCLFATPTIEALEERDLLLKPSGEGLQKRLYDIQLTFDSSVSTADQSKINAAFQDMITLATAAANYDFSNTAGNIDGIFRRYFPQGSELKVQALFRYLAGIGQTWGGQQLTSPDFSRLTIKRKTVQGTAQAFTQNPSSQHYDITFCNLAMPPVVPATIATTNFDGTQTSSKMEMLGAIVLHELLHASTIVNTVMSYNGPTDGTLRPVTIDDQKQSNLVGISETAYGSYQAWKLKQNHPDLAAINNDNFMYFALEAYWYSVLRPTGGFSNPERECLKGCTDVIAGVCSWCWSR